MNKDALLATVIGFTVGLFITGLFLLGPKLLSFLPTFSLPSFSFGQTNPSGSPAPSAKDFSLRIDSPLPEAIESSAELLVSGTTEPGAIIVIQTDIDEDVVLSSDEGKYAGKVTLIEGKNDLIVTSYGKTKQESQTITVFYTPEEF